jgi:hypothetical protein
MTVTQETISLTRRAERIGHELYMDNSFSSLDRYDDLYTRDINCCGTVRKLVKEYHRVLAIRY